MSRGAELALILSLVDEVSKTAKGIKGELLDVGKTSQGLQGMLADVGGGLAKIGTTAIVGGIAAASAAVTGLGLAMGKLAIDALPLQNIRGAFAGITGDADAMLDVLRRGSLGMVKDVELMKSYNTAAQLVGKTFADQLPTAMGYLSKVSAATGQDMGYMIDSLVKGVGRLSPMILDNLGIQVALSDATARAAEMFGVEADQLTKAQIQAGMMDVVLEKLAANTASMPEVAGTAAQQWAALGVTFGNVKDSIGLALIPALQAFLGPVASLAEEHGPRLAALFEEMIVPAIELVAQGLLDIAHGIGALAGGDLASFLELLWNGLYQVGEALGLADEQMRPFLDGITELGWAIGSFVQDTLIPFVQDHAEELKGALIAIGAVLAGAAIVSGVLAVAIAALANPITLVIAAVGLLGAAWAGNWGGIQDKTQAVIDWIMPFIEGALEFIRGLWAEHGDAVIDTVQGLWQGAQDATAAAWEWLQGAARAALAAIQAFWRDHGATVMRVLANSWDTIKAVFEGAFRILQALVRAVIAAFQGDWREFGVQLRVIVDTIWETIKRVFRNAFDSIRAIVGDLVRTIITKFKEIDWGAVGKSVIDGIASGIRNAAGFLADAARAAARAALDAAKGFLGIGSPSRLAAEMIGAPFVQGIEAGIARAMPSLRAQVQMQMGDLARGGQAGVSNVTYTRNYYLTANYGRYESELSLRDTVRALSMVG